jgi:general secretion pathway protein M
MKNDRLKELRELWDKLGTRKRRLVWAVTVVLALALLYGIVWNPMQRSLAKLRADLPTERAQLATMRAQATLVERVRRGASVKQPDNLASFAAQTAASHGLTGAMSRVEPEGSNAARVQLDGVPYGELLAWLADMQQNGAIRVETANIEAQTKAGAVNARLLLRAPGS